MKTISVSQTSSCGLSRAGRRRYFLLSLLAADSAIRNGIQITLGRSSRVLAIGCALWVLEQWSFLYHESGPHTDVPDNSMLIRCCFFP
jgi:hypothetical protein